MTKRVNKLFLIVAIFFLVLSIATPIIDYFITKAKIMEKGQFTTSVELNNANRDMLENMQGDYTRLDNFYSYFEYNYSAVNKDSIVYKAVMLLKTGEFTEIESWYQTNPEANETMFLFYILDKVLWLFVAYCIFIIPISMVDLFSKVIKKGVE